MEILFEKEAAKHINRLDKATKQRVKQAIDRLPDGDVRKLQGFLNDYRLRVGKLRILFSIEENMILIKDVLPRGQAYKKL